MRITENDPRKNEENKTFVRTGSHRVLSLPDGMADFSDILVRERVAMF